jgi:DNA-binding NarL/FixJ family response regulator
MSTEKKQIILVDDHTIVRNGLKVLIEKLGPYKIMAEYDNGMRLLEHLDRVAKADLIIMDRSMPEMNGEATMLALNAQQITKPVLMLTLNEDEDIIIQLFRMGIRGYLKKDCSADALKSAIVSVLETGYYHNEFLTFSLQTNTAAKKKTEQDIILDQLTVRERHFLKLVCHEKEYTYQQIADIMQVQPRTVDGYREDLFDKFGIKSKTGLVLFVLKHKLMDLL